MSIGIDRLLYALNQLGQIKVNKNKPVLVCILDKSYIKKYYELVNELRENNIASEVYLDQNKNLKKQLQYADRKKIDLAIICGEGPGMKEGILLILYLKSLKSSSVSLIQNSCVL